MLNATVKQCREVGCTDARDPTICLRLPSLPVEVLCVAEDECQLITATPVDFSMELQLRRKSVSKRS